MLGATDRWADGDSPAALTADGDAVVRSGRTISQTLELPAGRWEISLPYTSPAPLVVEVRASGSADRRVSLPPNLTDATSPWRAGSVRTRGGPVLVTASLARGLLQPWRQATVGAVAAVRVAPGELLPLSRACGRYVDWLR